jgi:hypothetical protein
MISPFIMLRLLPSFGEEMQDLLAIRGQKGVGRW